MSEPVYQMSGWLVLTVVLVLGYLAWLGIKRLSRQPRPVTAGASTSTPGPSPNPPSGSGGGRSIGKIVAIIIGGIIALLLILWVGSMLLGGFCENSLGFCETATTSPKEYRAARERQAQPVADVPPAGGEIDLPQCGAVDATLESCPSTRSVVIRSVPGYTTCHDPDYGSLSFAGEYRYGGDVWLPIPRDSDDDGTPDVQYLSREERFVSTTDRGQKLRYWYVRPGTSCRHT